MARHSNSGNAKQPQTNVSAGRSVRRSSNMPHSNSASGQYRNGNTSFVRENAGQTPLQRSRTAQRATASAAGRTTRSGTGKQTQNSPQNARNTRHRTQQSPTQRNHNSVGRGSHRPPKRRSKHPIIKWFAIIVGTLLMLGVVSFGILYVTTEIPNPEDMAIAQETTVTYNDGKTPIGTLAKQRRVIIDCNALPSYVGQAFVSSENRTFWNDHGVDFKGIARAIINNVRGGDRQGASTITQQYARRYYMNRENNIIGKIKEGVLAVKIAHTESKDTILCNYLNTIYMGREAYGIETAAKTYYGKSAKDLTLNEAATLAGLLPSPNYWNPGANPKQATIRMNRTLKIMHDDGYIDDTTYHKAIETGLPATQPYKKSNTYSGWKGYLLTTVERELTDSGRFTEEQLYTGGYTIVTTFDQQLQETMQNIGDNKPKDAPANLQIGGLSADPRDGSVRSMYAGNNFLTHPFNNVTQAMYQPGSTMKPFALLGAVQQKVNLNTLFNGNSPQIFRGAPKPVANALNISWGNINLYSATANSVNTVYMNVNEHLTPQKTAEIAHKAGIEGKIDKNSIYNVLGINNATLWDMTQAHSTIANNGTYNKLHTVTQVRDSDGNTLYTYHPLQQRRFSSSDTALVIKAMQGTIQYGTAQEARIIGRPLAGKSGTANDETAASFVGFAPQLINTWAIWNPKADGTPDIVPSFSGWGVTSTGYPSHLFTEFMKVALRNQPIMRFPVAIDHGYYGGPNGKWGLGGPGKSRRVWQENIPDNPIENSTSPDNANEQYNSTNTEQQTRTGDANIGDGNGITGEMGTTPSTSNGNDFNGDNESQPNTSGQ